MCFATWSLNSKNRDFPKGKCYFLQNPRFLLRSGHRWKTRKTREQITWKSIVFLEIDFWMILSQLGWILGSKLGLKSASPLDTFPSCVQEASKRRPRGAQERPRASQERAKSAQERPKSAQERPKSAQERPKSAQERPTRASGAPKVLSERYFSVHFFVFLCFSMFFCFCAFLCVFKCFSVLFLCFYVCLCIFVRFSVFSYIIFLCFPALFWIESILGSSCLRVQKFALPGEIWTQTPTAAPKLKPKPTPKPKPTSKRDSQAHPRVWEFRDMLRTRRSELQTFGRPKILEIDFRNGWVIQSRPILIWRVNPSLPVGSRS